MLNFLKKKGARAAVVAGSVGAAALTVAGSASAAVDASVATAFTQLQTDATSLAGIATPIVVAVLGLSIGIKLIKRFGNKI